MNVSTILISFSTTPAEGPPIPARDGSSDTPSEEEEDGALPSLELIILYIMLGLFLVLGVVGNALAFYIYYQKRDKTTSTLFILSLAATDFITCLISIPYTIITEVVQYHLVYDFICKAYLFSLTFNVPLSAFIMVAVGFDRYFCICHPFLHAMTVKRAKICLVCLTFIACVLGVITSLSYGVYQEEQVEVVIQELVTNSSMLNFSSAPTASEASDDTGSTLSTSFLGTGSVWGGAGSSGSVTDGDGGSRSSDATLYSVLNGSSPFRQYTTVHVGGGETNLPLDVTTRLTAGGSDLQGVLVNKTVNISMAVYYGICGTSTLIVSHKFINIYQKIYAGTFLFSFIIIALLYALIYRSILLRRAWRAKRKRMSCYASVTGPDTALEETQLTNLNNGNTNADITSCRVASRTSSALRDRMLYANIKTAAMLFVVTVVFIISFLPSWLSGLQVIPFNIILFNFYFFNNVANPFIYAFMNRTFRDDLKQLLRRIRNRLSS